MATLGANGGTRVGVGVAGVGDAWPTHADALRNLAARVRVVAVADAVPLRAEAAAADVGAVAAGGVLALARRPDVRAVLLGDPAWWGLAALDLLLTAEKPVLLAGPTDPFDDRLDALAARAASTGAVVVPDVSRRFSPGTLRLRELAATTLGAVHAVRVVAPRADPSPLAASYGQPTHAARFAELADWCAHLVPDPIREVAATADPAAAAGTVELRCARRVARHRRPRRRGRGDDHAGGRRRPRRGRRRGPGRRHLRPRRRHADRRGRIANRRPRRAGPDRGPVRANGPASRRC